MNDSYRNYLSRRDRSRYTRFVTAYLDSMVRLARRVMGDVEVADDVVQEAFLRLADARIQPADLKSPRAYVLRTVLNVARDHLRRAELRSHHEEEAGKLRVRSQPSVADEAIARESVRQIYAAIDDLGHDVRLASYDRGYRNLRDDFNVLEIEGLTISSSDNKVSIVRTFTENIRRLPTGLKRLQELRVTLFDEFRPMKRFTPASRAASMRCCVAVTFTSRVRSGSRSELGSLDTPAR